MIITKERFEKLYDDNISKREYDVIVEEVSSRVHEILTTLIPNLKKTGWWDYGNCDYQAEDSNGYFDPIRYREDIEIGGECRLPLSEFWNTDNSFPTRWLWDENFKQEADKELAEAKMTKLNEKNQAKQKRDELKAKKAAMRPIIMAKLTKEELKFIKFK